MWTHWGSGNWLMVGTSQSLWPSPSSVQSLWRPTFPMGNSQQSLLFPSPPPFLCPSHPWPHALLFLYENLRLISHCLMLCKRNNYPQQSPLIFRLKISLNLMGFINQPHCLSLHFQWTLSPLSLAVSVLTSQAQCSLTRRCLCAGLRELICRGIS